MIERRTFLAGMASLVAASLAAGQTTNKIPRVAIYVSTRAWRDGVVAGLRELGWKPGETVIVDWRGGAGEEEEVRELRTTRVDVAVVAGSKRIADAIKATHSVPIVGIDLESDPVASGFVRSLSRPGANVTGIWLDLPELAGKQVDFLREVHPSLSRLAVLWDDRVAGPQIAHVQAAARAGNFEVFTAPVRRVLDVDEALKRLLGTRPQALLILTAPVVFQALPRIAALAREHRLPSMSPFSTYPSSGGLMAYGPDFAATWRQAAGYVHRILRGANAGELPVERPVKFELIINASTARVLGLTLPQSLLIRANAVIQ
jgi:putative tryptophan/tyrosine transport system substrate-binding protein